VYEQYFFGAKVARVEGRIRIALSRNTKSFAFFLPAFSGKIKNENQSQFLHKEFSKMTDSTEEQSPKKERTKRKFISKILLRVTPQEHSAMKKKAAEHELSLSRFTVESALRDHPPPSRLEREQKIQMLFELRKLGNNINQIARAVNSARLSKQLPPPQKEILAAANSIKDLLAEMKKRL
jgi:predicted HicB family RNase H-like nuclease